MQYTKKGKMSLMTYPFYLKIFYKIVSYSLAAPSSVSSTLVFGALAFFAFPVLTLAAGALLSSVSEIFGL